MKARYLLGSGAALAMVLGGAEANAQLLPFFGGPPTYYIGPEGGWTSLSNQRIRLLRPLFL